MTATSQQAYRPSTRMNHTVMFRTYLSFCMYFGLQDLNPLPATICTYIQFLTRTFRSPQSIKNYTAAINLLHFINDRDPPVRTFAINNMLRAIMLTMRHITAQKLPITPILLKQICELCDQQQATGRMLKAVFLFLFFTFLRQSSVAPKTVRSFDVTRHMTRADIFYANPGYVTLVKWTKTNQTGQHVLLPVPALNQPRPSHCPVRAMRRMQRDYTPTDTSPARLPLFCHRNNIPVTTSYLTDALHIMLTSLRVPHQDYSLHSFRRGGASSAFHAGVNSTQVKRHGTWTSDCFWQYVTTSTMNSDVPAALAAVVVAAGHEPTMASDQTTS
jgi:hypothetical protein